MKLDTHQMPLFEITKPGKGFGKRPIQERFEEFHRLNPWVYREMARLAREWVRLGDEKIGAKALCEELRWHVKRESKGKETFKINNDFPSRYARRLMEQERDLAGLFELRELKAK